MHAKSLRLALCLAAATAVAAALCSSATAASLTAGYAGTGVLLPNGDTLLIGGAQGTPTSAVLNRIERISHIDGQVYPSPTTLSVAVASATATLLPDGEVLIVGGANASGTALNAIQVYNPITTALRTPFTLSTARKNHTATRLLDGRVLICGGEDATNTELASCEMYCPPSGASVSACGSGETSGTGESIANTASMLETNGRARHTAVRLSDGRVLISGGYDAVDGYLVTQELFNPTSNTFGSAHSLIEARADHRASLLGNGKVLLTGGYDGQDLLADDGFLSTTEIYDPVSDTVVPAQPMSGRKALHAQYVTNGGDVTIFGGLGNITTSYQAISAATINKASTLVGTSGAYPTMTLNPGSSNLQVNLDLALSANVSGRIISGAVLLSTITIPGLTGNQNDAIFPDGVESSPGNYSGSYIDLSNVVIYSTSPGHITGQFPVTFTSGRVNFTPQANVNLAGTSSGGSTADFFPTSAYNGTTGGVSICNGANSPVAGCTGGSSLILPVDITGLPTEYIGGTVQVGEIDVISVRLSSQGIADFTITGGKADVTGSVIGTDSSGTGELTLAGATFTNLTGTVSPTCGTAGCLDQTNFNAGNGWSGQSVTGSAIIKMVVSPITLNGSENFNTGVSTVIIRRMDFGDMETFNPKTNTWAIAARSSVPRQEALAVLRSNGAAYVLGGRDCGTSCIDLAGGNEIIPDIPLPANAGTQDQMTAPRGNHTTTLLPNGKLLVAGGSNGSNVLATAELLDPVTGKFTTTGSMYQPRDLHTATLLPNGNVLVVGGFTTNSVSTGSTSDCEIYYPKAGAWQRTSPLVTFGNVISSATGHTATLLADGSVLVAGGYQSGNGGGTTYLATAALYYSTSATWVPLPNMPVARALHTATLLQDGRVLLSGGINANGLLSGSNFGLIFDPGYPGYWYTTGSEATGLQEHAATALQDGRVLVAGGNNGFSETTASLIYTPGGQGNGSGSWTATINPLNYPRFNETLTTLPNGNVEAIGGATALGNSITQIEQFDVAASSWGIQATSNQFGLPDARANHTATVGLDGNVYVIGGFDGTKMLQTYDVGYFTAQTDVDTPNANDPSIRKSSLTAIDVTPFDRGQSVTLTGQRLQGAGESSGGGAAGGNSSFDSARLVMQALEPSSGASGQGGGGFTLDVTTRIYRSPDPNLFSNLSTSMTVTMPGNSAVAGNLLPYGWYALRTNENGIYSDGFAVQAGPANRAGPPGAVGSTVLGISSITWSWSPSTGTFDGYAVYSASSGIFIGTTSASGPWSCEDPPAAPITTSPCLVQTNLLPNTTGSIMVAAYNLSEDGPLTFSNTFYTLPSPPVNVAISSVGFSSLQLTWDADGNAPGTIYEVSESSDNFTTDFSTPVPTLLDVISTQTTISPLSLNTTYYFRVRAYNGVGLPSDFSTIVSTRTRAPIFNLAGTAIDPTTIEWTWSDPGGTVSFNVYNSTTGVKLGNVTTPFFFDTGLSTNTKRSVMVSAVTSSNGTLLEGPLSAGVTVYTLASSPTPANPAVTNISTNSFTGAWAPNGNPVGTVYTLQVYDDAGVLISTQSQTTKFSAGYSGFNFTSQPFTAKVVATNGDGINTAPVVLASTSTLPMAPANLFVTATTPSSISVSWSNQSNGSTTTYEISYSSDAFNDIITWIPFSSKVNTTSATITGLLTSTTYSIRVQAANLYNIRSAFSNTITTSPFNGGVALGALGVQVIADQNILLQGSVAGNRQLTLRIPSNSFPSDTFLTISTFTPTTSCPNGTPITLEIDPNPALEPLTPLTMTLAYSPSELTNASLATLMRVTDTGDCVPVKTVVDDTSHILTVQLNHISRYQVAQVSPETSAGDTFVFPNPLYLSRGQGYFTFSQMAAGSRVRVFTMRGELLADQTANDSGLSTWDATNREGRKVASGVYLVAVEAPDKTKKIMKVVVLR